MALKIAFLSPFLSLPGCVKIAVTDTGEIDKVKGIALCLGYSVTDSGTDSGLENSIELLDPIGEYQGYYDLDAGIGAIWIDEDSDAYLKFKELGGEKWILSL